MFAFWIAGGLFTLALTSDSKDSFWADLGIFIIWPVALGLFIRDDVLKIKKEEEDSHENP